MIRTTVLRTIAMPADVGPSGHVSAGWLLSRLTDAGSVLPGGHFGAQALLQGMGALTLLARPEAGDCVTFYAVVKEAGTLHVDVSLEAWAERRDATGSTLLLQVDTRYVPASSISPPSGRPI